MNEPYVKIRKDGVIQNPIIGRYESEFDNRQKRREHLNKPRDIGNNKGAHLSFAGLLRYAKRYQYIVCADGEQKTIIHYSLKTR